MAKVCSVLLVLCLVYSCLAIVNIPMKHSFLHGKHPLYNHFASRASVASDYENFQMGGNIYPVGIYWVSIDLGTPAQSLLVAVDSGSSDLLVPSATCVVSFYKFFTFLFEHLLIIFKRVVMNKIQDHLIQQKVQLFKLLDVQIIQFHVIFHVQDNVHL